MIKNIKFNLTELSKFDTTEYIAKIPFLMATGGEVSFNEGLNIIVGTNGSGKSTIINAIAERMAAIDKGVSTITQEWIVNQQESHFQAVKPELITVSHDNAGVFFSDARKERDGVLGGADAWYSQRESTGESAIRKSADLISILNGDYTYDGKIRNALEGRSLNKHWEEMLSTAIKNAGYVLDAPTVGKPTILLDEPETSLGLVNQILLFKLLDSDYVKSNYQVIIATHSPMILNMKDANIVELNADYVSTCNNLINGGNIGKKEILLANGIDSFTQAQSGWLNKLKDSTVSFNNPTNNKALLSLMDIGIIEEWRTKIKTSENGKEARHIRSANRNVRYKYNYGLTAKGLLLIKYF